MRAQIKIAKYPQWESTQVRSLVPNCFKHFDSLAWRSKSSEAAMQVEPNREGMELWMRKSIVVLRVPSLEVSTFKQPFHGPSRKVRRHTCVTVGRDQNKWLRNMRKRTGDKTVEIAAPTSARSRA